MIYRAKDHITYKDGISLNFGANWDILHAHDYWKFILIVAPVTHTINNQTQQAGIARSLIGFYVFPFDFAYKIVNGQFVVHAVFVVSYSDYEFGRQTKF